MPALLIGYNGFNPVLVGAVTASLLLGMHDSGLFDAVLPSLVECGALR